MADVLHLGKHRKARKRAAEQARADENAIRHGRTRAERERDAAPGIRLAAAVDGARRDPPAEPVVADGVDGVSTEADDDAPS